MKNTNRFLFEDNQKQNIHKASDTQKNGNDMQTELDSIFP